MKDRCCNRLSDHEDFRLDKTSSPVIKSLLIQVTSVSYFIINTLSSKTIPFWKTLTFTGCRDSIKKNNRTINVEFLNLIASSAKGITIVGLLVNLKNKKSNI